MFDNMIEFTKISTSSTLQVVEDLGITDIIISLYITHIKTLLPILFVRRNFDSDADFTSKKTARSDFFNDSIDQWRRKGGRGKGIQY